MFICTSYFSFFFYSYRDHRNLHSFPTRRSSDLDQNRVPNCHVVGKAAVIHVDRIAFFTLRSVHSEFQNVAGLQMQIGLRSEEHTSELQSRRDLVCRLLLEKKKKLKYTTTLMILI